MAFTIDDEAAEIVLRAEARPWRNRRQSLPSKWSTLPSPSVAHTVPSGPAAMPRTRALRGAPTAERSNASRHPDPRTKARSGSPPRGRPSRGTRPARQGRGRPCGLFECRCRRRPRSSPAAMNTVSPHTARSAMRSSGRWPARRVYCLKPAASRQTRPWLEVDAHTMSAARAGTTAASSAARAAKAAGAALVLIQPGCPSRCPPLG